MDEDQFTLEEVIALGGNKEDYHMLKHVEAIPVDKNSLGKDVDEIEVRGFIEKLGFSGKLQTQTLKGEKTPQQSNTAGPLETIPNVAKKRKTLMLTTANSGQKLKNKTKKDAQMIQNNTTKKEGFPSFKLSSNWNKPDELPKKLLLTTSDPWFSILADDKAGKPTIAMHIIEDLKGYGTNLLENELSLHKKKKDSSERAAGGNAAFIHTVAASGTLSDRIAALSYMVQRNSVHNFHFLELLLNMAKKKGKREAIMGIESIRDLLLGDLLPGNRKLRSFHQHPLDDVVSSMEKKESICKWSRVECQRRLLLWAFEHRLKQFVTMFVNQLKTLAGDPLEVSKTKAMSVALNLLLSKPEQEDSLLALLVNKLGDPKFRIASKALSMLNRLVAEHPLMQGIVVKEVKNLLLVPKLASRAQYYCVCFLSSQMLSHDRKDVAKSLIHIYMNFFKSCVKKRNVENKMLSALLTGVNRAFPYADLADESIIHEMDILFKTVHTSSLSTTVQALMLLFQVYSSRDEVSDRFYNALYSSLFHSELPISTHRHAMYLNLLYRSLKADMCEPRVQAFVKRLLQITSLHKPAFCAAVLMLMSELSRCRPSLSQRFLKSLSSGDGKSFASTEDRGAFDDDEEHFVDVAEESDAEERMEKPSKTSKSWVHQHQAAMQRGMTTYDPLHRNPQYCGADKVPLWELHTLTRHFHPTVALYACNHLKPSGAAEAISGDPLQDYTLIKFLDRFVYRNPKSNEPKKKKKNQRVPVVSAHRRKRQATFANAAAVNSAEFLMKEKYSPEEVFFQKFFSSRVGKQRVRTRKEGGEDDVESLSDDEFDDFINSVDGQKEIDQELKFSDHIYKRDNSTVEDDLESGDEESDLDIEENWGDEEGYGFEMEEGEEDFLDDAGAFVTDAVPKKRKITTETSKFNKRSRHDGEELSLMLEEHAGEEFDSISSSAVRNTDRSSAKQLRWERKREEKDIVRRKKENKRKGFTHNDKRISTKRFPKTQRKSFGKRNEYKKSRK